MDAIPPEHFLALSRLDGILGSSESVYDTSTLAAHDFDVDNRTGFMPPQAPPARLPAEWEPWELVLDGAIVEGLQLGDKPGLTGAEKSRSEAWRLSVRQLPVIPISGLIRSETNLRRAHLVLAWTMHFYIHSLPPDVPVVIPAPITIPLFHICTQLQLPPVLTYSDTVLYNWTLKTSSNRPTPALDNLQSQTLFTGTNDEQEFYLTSARMELRGVEALELMRATMDEAFVGDDLAMRRITSFLTRLATVIGELQALLANVRDGCDPSTFYNAIRPWFRGADSDPANRRWEFEGMASDPAWVYPAELSGPSAGQSSLVHALDMFLGVDEFSHAPGLTGHQIQVQPQTQTKKSAFLTRMQLYMPRHHRNFLNHLAANPRPLRAIVTGGENAELLGAYNAAVGALKRFRDHHIQIVTSYIIQPARLAAKARESEPEATIESESHGAAPLKGTGGTELARFLKAVLILSFVLVDLVPNLVGSGTSISLQAVTTVLSWSPAPSHHETAAQSTPTILTVDTPAHPRPVPFVDRSILQKLAELEISPDPDERPYFASGSSPRPPIVTRIPESRKALSHLPSDSDICGPTLSPCRFLLPLRIGEQESKARIHLMEIMQLAQRLNRTLVLPNVGKSRVGACFKFSLETYYDVQRLTDELELGPTIVKLDVFRRWVKARAPSAQLVFLSAKPDSQPTVAEVITTPFYNEDVSIRAGPFGASEDQFACLARFSGLRLDAHAPLHIHLKAHAQDHSIAASIVDALTRPDVQAIAAAAATHPLSLSDTEYDSAATLDPTVLIVDWDLRHPIFPSVATLPSPPALHYAPHLHALAAALAPARTVHDGPLAHGVHGVRGVWFASDYPYAVHRTPGVDFGSLSAVARMPSKAKSGTFRDVGPLHAEAVGIFGDAFEAGGELEGWEVVELTEERIAALDDAHGDSERELLEDAGVRGIVDKIIGTRATLFVSGASPGCARASSFTRQIVNERRASLGKLDDGELPMLQNVVELFG
ncbi:Indoleamine 2,3-dioxygenase [Mycena sanguinolenta]|uniref:Indoleamine 2,3-dioxygenase n=1 Tax=Mycena sanguinolenta TaxID=230812 RepID=A0A8H7DG99_9AGAR|nr:Indoleamine 2,3-dioxygenase [Mycena sanguinolenta]